MQRIHAFQTVLTVLMVFHIGCLPGSEKSDSPSGTIAATTNNSGGMGGASTGMMGTNNASGTPVDMAPPEPPPKCERKGLKDAEISVQRVKNGLEYSAEIEGDNGKNKMVVTVYQSQDFIGPTSPGEYALDGVNYRDCGLCPVIYTDIDPDTGKWKKTFYADRGSIEFTEIEGGKMKGTFKDVVFYEVELAENDFTSTRVKDGETWCFDSFDIEGEAPGGAPPGGGGGPGGGPGGGGGVGNTPPAGVCEREDLACVGEVVGVFELQNCETGEMVKITDHFKDKKAGWLVLTTEWCPGCNSWLPQVSGFDNDENHESLKVAYILGENRQYAKPSLNECKAYGARYNVPTDSMFIDHNGDDSFRWTFARMWPYVGANGSFGLPFNAVINAETMEYVYADKGPTGGGPVEMVRQLMGL